MTYVTVISLDIYASTILVPFFGYDVTVNACVTNKRPLVTVYPLAVPLVYDTFLFILLVRNGLTRPRHMRTTLVRQLHLEGTFYFIITIGLRLMNIIVISSANIAYATFALYFFWATINTSLNRMLITLSSVAAAAQLPEQPAVPFSKETHMESDTYTMSDISYSSRGGMAVRASHLDLSNPVFNGPTLGNHSVAVYPITEGMGPDIEATLVEGEDYDGAKLSRGRSLKDHLRSLH